jgi:hypothetical protein
MKKQLILFLCASTLCTAAFGEIPEKKQKNPGRTADAPGVCPEGTRAAPATGPGVACMAINTKGTGAAGRSSHDVHELEKISFTVTGEGLGAPPGVTYLKIRIEPNGEVYADEAVLRLVCAGGELRNAALWTVTGADASGKRTHHPVTFVKEWGPSTPQFRALSSTYLKRKLNRAPGGGGGGWQQVEVVGSATVCPSAEAAPAPR